MLDEAAAIGLITKAFVKRVRIRPMITTSDLDASATMRPTKLLGCANEQPSDAATSTVGSDNQTRNATEKAIGMKQRNAMEGDNTNDPPSRFGCKNSGR